MGHVLNLSNVVRKVRPYYPFSALHIIWSRLDKQAKTILDVGCGKGEPMSFINKDGNFDVTGIDLFQPYLEEAERKAVYRRLMIGNALSLPFENKAFDAVICMELLEHLEERDGIALLGELERVARKQILLTTPIGKYEQHAYDGNRYQEHKFIWTVGALQLHGYKIWGTGIRGLPREETRLGFIRFFREGAYALGGVFSYYIPQLACHVVAEKKLNA
jgi:SAM-dependent methyltransferase